MAITTRPRHMGVEYTYETERLQDGSNPDLIQVDPLPEPEANEHEHTHAHGHHHHEGEHRHEHERTHTDERSANPRRWRHIASFLLASSVTEVAVEATTEHQPRAAVGLDAFHTLLADLPDYLARGEVRMVPLGMLAVGVTTFGDKVKKGLGKVKEKVVGGAMIAGNAVAMAYTGWDIANKPEEYNPVEFPVHNWKSYLAPAIGLTAVSATSRAARKFKSSSNHTDRDGAEHIELDRSDAEGRLIGAALNPFTAAGAAMWYGGKGIKFAVNRLIKGEHCHEHGSSERKAKLWRRARYALGGLALASSFAVQTSHDTKPVAAPEAVTAADDAWGGADALDRPLTESIVVNLAEWNPATGEGSVWELAEDQAEVVLGRKATNAEVLTLTTETLEHNNWTWADGPKLQENTPVIILDASQAKQTLLKP